MSGRARGRVDGTVHAWGGNDLGRLGDGSTVASPLPVTLVAPARIVAASAGYNHSLSLAGDGTRSFRAHCGFLRDFSIARSGQRVEVGTAWSRDHLRAPP